MIYVQHMDGYGMNQHRYMNSDYGRTVIYRNVDNGCDHYGNDFSKSQKRDFYNRYNGATLYMNNQYNNYRDSGNNW